MRLGTNLYLLSSSEAYEKIFCETYIYKEKKEYHSDRLEVIIGTHCPDLSQRGA